jgi:hypothetical protein
MNSTFNLICADDGSVTEYVYVCTVAFNYWDYVVSVSSEWISMEHWWNYTDMAKPKPWAKIYPSSTRPPEVLHRLAWDQTYTSKFEGLCLTTWAMVWPDKVLSGRYLGLPMFYRNLLPQSQAVAQWLRHCATNRKVAGLIPNGVSGIFHWHTPSSRTMALGSTQPLTEMSTRNISWR